MKLTKLLFLTLGGVFSFAGVADATPIGYTANPYPPYSSTARWDSFAGAVFGGYAPPGNANNGFLSGGVPDYATGFSTATLSQSTGSPRSGFGVVNDDYFYLSSATSGSEDAVATHWQIDLERVQSVTALTLQIKVSSPDLDFFTAPILNDGTLNYNYSFSGSEATGESVVFGGNTLNLYILTYEWTDLDIAEFTPFSITFSSIPEGNAHSLLDGIQVNAVPEPGTWAALALGAGVLAVGRRFRRKA